MPELHDVLWELILDFFELSHTIRAAKELRKIARVSRIFAYRARIHEDNITVPDFRMDFTLPEESSDSDDSGVWNWEFNDYESPDDYPDEYYAYLGG